MSAPGPHPGPPLDFVRRRLPWLAESRDPRLRRLARGPWMRLYRPRRTPLYFGRGAEHRFDDPKRKYGVLYVGEDANCAFVESYGESLLAGSGPWSHRLVTLHELGSRGLGRIELRGGGALKVVDFTGKGLALLGADERIGGGGEYGPAQAYSRAVWEHPQLPDGLCYRARHDPSLLCIAIFDRVRPRLRAVAMGSLAHPSNGSRLKGALARYRVGILP